MRAFVAIELPPRGSDLTARAPRPPEHLTLRFLGEIDPVAVDALATEIRRAVSTIPRFDLVLEGVGAFPSPGRPRVVWQGAGTGREALLALAGAVRAAVVAAGHPEEPTPFVPHVTLFRVRSPRDLQRARALLDGVEPVPPPRRVPVDSVDLKSSVLGASGAVHRLLARAYLRGASS